MYQFIVLAGRFVCTIGIVTLYVATLSFMVTIICVNTLYHSTILCGCCLDGTSTLFRQGFLTTKALLPGSYIRSNLKAGASTQSANESRVANPASISMD